MHLLATAPCCLSTAHLGSRHAAGQRQSQDSACRVGGGGLSLLSHSLAVSSMACRDQAAVSTPSSPRDYCVSFLSLVFRDQQCRPSSLQPSEAWPQDRRDLEKAESQPEVIFCGLPGASATVSHLPEAGASAMPSTVFLLQIPY